MLAWSVVIFLFLGFVFYFGVCRIYSQKKLGQKKGMKIDCGNTNELLIDLILFVLPKKRK